MADITCPVCGEINSSDQEFCQFCQSRLQPLTGALKGADAPITPGQIPTKKVTAELEPILPQWLRDARDKARRNAEEQASRPPEPLPPADASPPDLLAGLQSQKGEDEEETPDWLSNITGSKSKPKKADTGSTEVHWVELGKPNEFTQEEEPSISATQAPIESTDEDSLPPWLTGIEPAEGGVDELTAWLHEAESQREGPSAQEPSPATESDFGTPEAFSGSSEELPVWLKNLQEEKPASTEIPQMESPFTEEKSDSDWLNDMQTQQSETGLESAEKEEPFSTEVPDWLKDATTSSDSGPGDVPAWLQPPSSPAFISEEPVEKAPQEDVPDWLKAAAPKSSVFSEEPAAPIPTETPDWLASLQKDADARAFEPEKSEEGAPPAFVEDSLANLSTESLFTEMPDWLSNAGNAESPSTPLGAPSSQPTAGSEAITPGELPSWVQAMRPIETSAGETPVSVSGDQTLETRGPLAGLQGVLPVIPGIGASSKPKAHSIKLQATEEQLAHSTLLEQVLAAETAPEPITSFSPLATQRGLRWVLALLLLFIVSSLLFLHTQTFSLPVGETDEIRNARLAIEGISENVPVLVVMDYEPALTGEMEATAAPLLDHLIILRHPVLAFISTSPTGGLLAERLFSGPLQDRGYQRGTQYLNLGYLPGGLAGVRSFAQNPVAAAPFNIDRAPAWIGTPLESVNSLSRFAAMIVITDNAESARTWLEQTNTSRGAMPVVVVSSAQAAPMLEPYYDSHQVNGVVSGLYGGAIFEQNNAGRPGLARTYWDTFSIGMFLAIALILVGGLWNLTLGLRDRAAAEGR